MGRKQESSFGVFARTGVTLLALGFGSALFGALVVGPLLGKQLGHNPRSSSTPPSSSVQLARTVLDDSSAYSGGRSSGEATHEEPAREEPEAAVKSKPEDDAHSVEGTGAETATPSDAGSYSGPTEDPDATSADVTDRGTAAEPPSVAVRSEPFSKREALRSAEEPRVRALAEPEPPKRSERVRTERSERTEVDPTSRRTEEPRRPERDRDTQREADPSARTDRSNERKPTSLREEEPATERRTRVVRDREASRERETERETEKRSEPEKRRTVRVHRAEEDTRDRKSERREETAPAREERKSSRERVAEELERERSSTRDERRTARTESPRRSERSNKTETAKAADEQNDTNTESTASEKKLYRVRVGRVHPREEAEKLRDELKDATGVDAFLVPVGDGFQIQTGAYKHKSNAEKVAATLRAGNYRTVVRQDK